MDEWLDEQEIGRCKSAAGVKSGGEKKDKKYLMNWVNWKSSFHIAKTYVNSYTTCFFILKKEDVRWYDFNSFTGDWYKQLVLEKQ